MRTKPPHPNLLPRPQKRHLLTWAASNDAPNSINCVVTTDVCRHIATEFAQTYYTTISSSSLTQLCTKCANFSVSETTYNELSERVREYVHGAATALNLLPQSVPSYIMSDRDALYSDWMNVRSDIEGIWRITSQIHDWLEQASNDESAKRDTPEPIREAGRGEADGDTGDHTSGT
jgi:hypothetical protein